MRNNCEQIPSGGSRLGPGPAGAQSPKSCPGPPKFSISIVISLSRCCLPNDEGPAPPQKKTFFPRTAAADALDQWCLRRLLGITWQDHITNIEVRERTGVPAVSETISQRRLSMLGHVSRMPPSADACKAIYQDILSDWRRRPGRPGLLAAIHRDLRQFDIDLDNVPELAADRLLWRVLIPGATHHSGVCYRR